MTLDGQVALVTGASRGIGQAIAARLARDGATVFGTATSDGGADSINSDLGELGVTGRVLDQTDADAVQSLFKDLGAVDILVNNAGVTRDNLMLRMSEDDWQNVIDTNLTGVFRTCRAALRGMMKKRAGRIVNVGSVVASMGNPGQANYCAAKAGLEGFSRSLAREIGSRNITVNVVAPGFIDTDMTRALADETRDTMRTQIPLGRLGEVDDVAAAVGYLVSAEAGYITGTTIHVNGGMFMG